MSGKGSDGGRRGGFTLIEMLVVITIMGILIAVGLSSFNTGDGVALGAAADQVASAARTARERALATGEPVLLGFLVEGGDEVGGRRSLHTQVWEDGGWRAAAEPEVMPEGIYLDVGRSSGLLEGTFRPRKDGAEAAFLGIVFRPDQYCAEGGARIVLMAGVREDAGGEPRAKRAGLTAGFLVSRTGHVTRSDPEEVAP